MDVREFQLWHDAAELLRLKALFDLLDALRKAYHADSSSYQEAVLHLRADIRTIEIGREAMIDESWENLRRGT